MRVATTMITVACGTVSAIALQKSVLNLVPAVSNPPSPNPDDSQQADRETAPTPITAISTPENLSVKQGPNAQQRAQPVNGSKQSGALRQPGQPDQPAKSAIEAELAKVDAAISRTPSPALPDLLPLPRVNVSTTVAAIPAATQAREIAPPETISNDSQRRSTGLLSAQAMPMGDIQGHWAQNDIEALVSRGIVQGYTDGSFRPDQSVTGAEFATMTRKAFREVPISYRDLQAAIPDRSATRADAAAFVYRTLANTEQSPLSPTVQVSGEVVRPGAYTLGTVGARLEREAMPTVTQAIQQAGGAKSAANLRQVQIHRATETGSKQIIDVNVWQMLQTGDRSQDVALKQGDKVVVPPASGNSLTVSAASPVSNQTVKVSVLGAVPKPGVMQVSAASAIHQVLQEVGEMSSPDQRMVQMIRFNPNGTVSQQQLALNTIASANPALQNNDILLIRHPGIAETPVLSKPMMDLLSRVLPIAVS